MRKRLFPLALAVFFTSAAPVEAQDLDAFENKVTEFTLDNGLHFIVIERHNAPVIACHTYADVGSVDEVKGITGMAHMFEHMAFKGTTTIGTEDWAAEKEVLEKMDRIFDEIRSEKAKGVRADAKIIEGLEAEFEEAQTRAQEFVNDEYEDVLGLRGSSGLNANTWFDATNYMVSLPSNQLEFWMFVEAQRWKDPIFREFYKERNVVMEERRMRTENQPIGKLLEEFLAASYKAHPYGEPAIGHSSDILSYTRDEAKKFFKTYYGPGNLTIAISGDVNPKDVKKFAGYYFDDIPARPDPPLVETVEPKQQGERTVTIIDPSQPVLIMGYHKPSMYHADDAVFDAIADLMGNGRTSRLYQALVKEKQVATFAGGFGGLVGGKYPGLFIFFAIPAPDHTTEECKEAIMAEINRLQDELVSEEDLSKARRRARAGLLRTMNSNAGMAQILSSTYAVRGDWRDAFHSLDRIDAVEAADIKRVAQEFFTPENRTVATIETESPS